MTPLNTYYLFLNYPLAILVFSDFVITLRSGLTFVAHDATYHNYDYLFLTGLGVPSTSTKHILQFPATDRRSWKQNLGISTLNDYDIN